MKNINETINESMNNYNICQHLKQNIKNVATYPNDDEKIYIEIIKNYKLCIYNDSSRKLFLAYILIGDNVQKDNFEISMYGKNNMTNEETTKEEAFDSLLKKLYNHNSNIYNLK